MTSKKTLAGLMTLSLLVLSIGIFAYQLSEDKQTLKTQLESKNQVIEEKNNIISNYEENITQKKQKLSTIKSEKEKENFIDNIFTNILKEKKPNVTIDKITINQKTNFLS